MSQTLEVKGTITLPTTIQEPTQEVPGSLIVFGLPKCGKTTAISQLPNCLIIDVERGSGFVHCMRMQPDKDIKPVALFRWIKEVAKAVREAGRPYDYVAIDTTSFLDDASEWVGTYNYMNSPQGKKFNRDAGGMKLKREDSGYQSVHTLPDGNGYRWSREAMQDLFNDLKDLGRICTIFVCHVKDKFVVAKQANTEVRSLDIALTGKVKDIFSRWVDAIAYVYNKDGELQVSFKGNEDKLGGMRGATHLRGYEGILDWKQIFKL